MFLNSHFQAYLIHYHQTYVHVITFTAISYSLHYTYVPVFTFTAISYSLHHTYVPVITFSGISYSLHQTHVHVTIFIDISYSLHQAHVPVITFLTFLIHYIHHTSCVITTPNNNTSIFIPRAVVAAIVWELDFYLPNAISVFHSLSYEFESCQIHIRVYLMQLYMIRFVSELQQIRGFLWDFWFAPPILEAPRSL